MTTKNFESLWQDVLDAGNAAAQAAKPTPMIVGEAKSLFTDEIDYSKPTYYVAGGVCGFAYVRTKGNTAFGRWAKKAGYMRPGYPTGLMYSVRAGGQSLEIKEAFAQAAVGVLRAAGIDAWVESRMD
jgi:hypothetical protein